MDKIINYIEKWNDYQNKKMSVLTGKIEELGNSISLLNQRKISFWQKRKRNQIKKRISQKIITLYDRKNEIGFEKVYHMSEAITLDQFFKNAKEEILNKEEYEDAFKCYQELLKLKSDLSWVEKKAHFYFTKQEIEQLNHRFFRFNSEIEPYKDFIEFSLCHQDFFEKKQEEDFDKKNFVLLFQNAGDILRHCLKGRLSYSTYLTYIKILDSFNPKVEKEDDRFLSVDELRKLKRKLLKEIDEIEDQEQIHKHYERLNQLSQMILERRLK